jgi:branched-subunit amino acid transport protein
MQPSIYVYILVMGLVTYVIRMLPLVLLRREITNVTIRSFLYYVPYVTLAVMTFPAILSATGSPVSAWCALLAGAALAWQGKSLLTVSVSACAVVFVLEHFLLQ